MCSDEPRRHSKCVGVLFGKCLVANSFVVVAEVEVEEEEEEEEEGDKIQTVTKDACGRFHTDSERRN